MKNMSQFVEICLTVGMLGLCGCESGGESDGDSGGGPADVRPGALVAQIGGIFGPAYEVVLNDSNSVVYAYNRETFTTYAGTQRETIRVDEARWTAFRQALDEARVWDWKSEYVDPDIMDGTSWKLQVRYADAAIDTRGRNKYPDRDQFDRFLQGVRDLTGGRDFR